MPSRRHRRPWVRIAGVVGGGAVLGVALSAALDPAGLSVSPWFTGALAIAAFGAVSLGRTLLDELETPVVVPHGREVVLTTPPEMFARLERRLAAATRQRRLFVVGLQPLLLDLVRDRLRVHRTLDLDAALRENPDLARRTLGDLLWHWMTTTAIEGPAPTPQELQAMLARIEAL